VAVLREAGALTVRQACCLACAGSAVRNRGRAASAVVYTQIMRSSSSMPSQLTQQSAGLLAASLAITVHTRTAALTRTHDMHLQEAN
jgi:hypothetical protein